MRKRDEIVAEIKRIAEKLGRAPSKAELCKSGKVSWHQVYKHFRGMRAAVRTAGLEPGPRGCPADENVMVLDWGRVVRELGRLPNRAEYDERGKHHSVTLHARLGWSQMAHRFVLLVREFHIEPEWKDVVEVVWGKFPLLMRLQNPTPLKHRGTGETEERESGADPRQAGTGLRRWPQIGQGQISRELTRTNAKWGLVYTTQISLWNLIKDGLFFRILQKLEFPLSLMVLFLHSYFLRSRTNQCLLRRGFLLWMTRKSTSMLSFKAFN
jgi:hypothetical protein